MRLCCEIKPFINPMRFLLFRSTFSRGRQDLRLLNSLPQADNFHEQGDAPDQNADSYGGGGDILDDADFFVMAGFHEVAKRFNGRVDHFSTNISWVN